MKKGHKKTRQTTGFLSFSNIDYLKEIPKPAVTTE
jgi:hypothetical protein